MIKIKNKHKILSKILKVHRLSVRNNKPLGTGNIAESVKALFGQHHSSHLLRQKGLSIVSVLQHHNNKKYVLHNFYIILYRLVLMC